MMCDMDKYENRRQRLLKLRDEKCGGKAVTLAKKIEREPSYVSRMFYEEGKTGKKRIADNMVEVIENAFNLPRGWMDVIQDEEKPNGGDNFTYAGPHIPGKRYPVISKVMAGAWNEAFEAYTLKDIDLWFESNAHIQGEGFWLLVEGDSMTAPMGLSIPEGTYVLFDTGKDPKNGSLVIAKLTDDNEATFKKLVVDGGTRYLKGLNPLWPLMPINGNCRIIGVAVETKLMLP